MEIRQPGFQLPISDLRKWDDQRRRNTEFAHLDCFEGNSPHPLTRVDSYPGLRGMALRTDFKSLNLCQSGDPLERGLMLSGPLLGVTGGALMLLAKDGALSANLIKDGQVTALPVSGNPGDFGETIHSGSRIELPGNQVLNFFRGTNGDSSLIFHRERDGLGISASYFDSMDRPPRMHTLSVESVAWQGTARSTYRVALDCDQQGLPRSVELSSHQRIDGMEDSGVVKRLRGTQAFSLRDPDKDARYIAPPTSEELYIVAKSVMDQFDAQNK